MSFFNAKKNEVPLCLFGFEHINRYNDPLQDNNVVAKIVPGEFYITRHAEMITTVLGSCISVCAYDLVNGIGGMNHFMLPSMGSEGQVEDWHVNGCGRYGDLAMKNLLEGMIKHGAKREDLKIKVFGGGQILRSKGYVGERNIEFIIEYIANKNLTVDGIDVGDDFPRKINFFPLTGRVMVRKLMKLNNDTIFQREKSYDDDLSHRPL